MANKNKKSDEATKVRLKFGLSDYFNANFANAKSWAGGSFLIKSCSGYKLLFPNSIFQEYAQLRTGLHHHLEPELPVLCKLWAGFAFDGGWNGTGINRLEITGSNRASNFSHYNAIHKDYSPEFSRFDWLASKNKEHVYVDSMRELEVCLEGQKINLKSFWISGDITLPMEFAENLVELASKFPPSSIEISCLTKAKNFTQNYKEYINGDTYEAESKFIELDEETFRAEVHGADLNQPVSKNNFLQVIGHQKYNQQKDIESLLKRIDNLFGVKQDQEVSLGERIQRLEESAENLHINSKRSLVVGFLLLAMMILLFVTL